MLLCEPKEKHGNVRNISEIAHREDKQQELHQNIKLNEKVW